MQLWKLPLLSLVYLLNTVAMAAGAGASVRYKCTTEGVPLFDSQNRQISDQRQNEVTYTAGTDVNANISVGDRHFIVWYQEDFISILKQGPEGMPLNQVLPFDKKVRIQLQMNYLGNDKTVTCEITKL